MPWEIDEFLTLSRKLKKSYYYLDDNDEITFHVCLNLTNYLFDWDKSKIKKDFFIDKFNQTLKILNNSYTIENKIYEGVENYGHLDDEKEIFKRHNEYDGILSICPDVHFHESLLANIFEAFKQIENDFFIITPENSKMWDNSWDEITNKQLLNVKFSNHDRIDVYAIELITENNLDNISIEAVKNNKWSGWFDLKSSNLVKLFPPPENWIGYGQYDLYLMVLLSKYKASNINFDFQQYVIRNQVIGKYSNINFKNIYKKNLIFKNIKQYSRDLLQANLEQVINKKLGE
jgi:hypothetical protein